MLEYLESTEFSSLVRSELWGWPLALTVHAFGTAMVVGFVLIVGLRLMGLFEQIPYTSLGRLIPVVWLGLFIQILSGFVLWMSKPTRYVADGAFVLKVVLILLGVVMTLSFQRQLRRESPAWQANGMATSRAARFMAATLIVWCGVLVAGRLTGYLGAL